MNPHLFQALTKISVDLRQLRVRWALLGGLAVSLHAEPRTTQDIDLGIAVADDREAERIVGDLMARRYEMEWGLERASPRRMSVVRLEMKSEPGPRLDVDFIFAVSGIEREIVAAAELLEVLPGVALPVITKGHLLALKTLAGRDKDRADIQSLLRVASASDLAETREALDLIERRRFHKKKDLQNELEEHVRRFSRSF